MSSLKAETENNLTTDVLWYKYMFAINYGEEIDLRWLIVITIT